MQKKIRFLKFITISSIIILLFSYRDFLYTIKLMIFHFYNYQMLPLDPYYKIILKYSGVINENFRFPWEWRVIPNFINWIVYEIVPCVRPMIVPVEITSQTYCSIWSISLVNFFAGIMSQVLLCYYAFKKLNRDVYESIFLIFISYFLIKFLDPFGVDRISFLFLIIFLFFSQSPFAYIFIIILIFFNDKSLLFITSYYFCTNIDFKNLNKILSNKKFLLSFFISLIYAIFTITLILGINSDEVVYNYFSFHGLVNSIIPLLISIFAFIYNFDNSKILKKFNLNKNFLFLILIFLASGLLLGGPGNAGRYMIYGSIPFIPLLNFQIIKIIKKILNLNS